MDLNSAWTTVTSPHLKTLIREKHNFRLQEFGFPDQQLTLKACKRSFTEQLDPAPCFTWGLCMYFTELNPLST